MHMLPPVSSIPVFFGLPPARNPSLGVDSVVFWAQSVVFILTTNFRTPAAEPLHNARQRQSNRLLPCFRTIPTLLYLLKKGPKVSKTEFGRLSQVNVLWFRSQCHQLMPVTSAELLFEDNKYIFQHEVALLHSVKSTQA